MTFPNKGFGQRATKTSAVPRRATSKPSASSEVKIALSAEMKERIFAIEDVRKETQQIRAELLKGPVVAVSVDGKAIDTLPFRLFLVASSKVREMYASEARVFPNFSASKSVDKASVKKPLQFLKDLSTKKTVFSLKKSQDGSVARDLALVEAADNLGMRRYASNIVFFWQRIVMHPDRRPTLEEMSAVETYCPAMMDDKVFKAVANRMAHDLIDGHADVQSFHKHDAEFPKLHGVVLNIYAGLAAAKAERLRRQEEHAAYVAEKKAAAAEEKSQFAQEKIDWEAARKAMNLGGGVKTVTAEQAAFFIRR